MKLLRIACLCSLLCFSGTLIANTVSFGLNTPASGVPGAIDFATVTISANPDSIDFLIDISEDEFAPGSTPGLQAFYFNSGITLSGVSVSGAAKWQLNRDFGTGPGDGFPAPGFGRFNTKYAVIPSYANSAYSNLDQLAFTLSASDDSLLGYYALDNAQGYAFAAHITGYNNGAGGTGGWFGGSVAQTPVPAAFWLFGTALIGLIGFSRRRLAQQN